MMGLGSDKCAWQFYKKWLMVSLMWLRMID